MELFENTLLHDVENEWEMNSLRQSCAAFGRELEMLEGRMSRVTAHSGAIKNMLQGLNRISVEASQARNEIRRLNEEVSRMQNRVEAGGFTPTGYSGSGIDSTNWFASFDSTVFHFKLQPSNLDSDSGDLYATVKDGLDIVKDAILIYTTKSKAQVVSLVKNTISFFKNLSGFFGDNTNGSIDYFSSFANIQHDLFNNSVASLTTLQQRSMNAYLLSVSEYNDSDDEELSKEINAYLDFNQRLQSFENLAGIAYGRGYEEAFKNGNGFELLNELETRSKKVEVVYEKMGYFQGQQDVEYYRLLIDEQINILDNEDIENMSGAEVTAKWQIAEANAQISMQISDVGLEVMGMYEVIRDRIGRTMLLNKEVYENAHIFSAGFGVAYSDEMEALNKYIPRLRLLIDSENHQFDPILIQTAINHADETGRNANLYYYGLLNNLDIDVIDSILDDTTITELYDVFGLVYKLNSSGINSSNIDALSMRGLMKDDDSITANSVIEEETLIYNNRIAEQEAEERRLQEEHRFQEQQATLLGINVDNYIFRNTPAEDYESQEYLDFLSSDFENSLRSAIMGYPADFINTLFEISDGLVKSEDFDEYEGSLDFLEMITVISETITDHVDSNDENYESILLGLSRIDKVELQMALENAVLYGIRKDLNDLLFGYQSRAYGLPYVPYDGYLARLHEGERVLTAQEARGYNQQGIVNHITIDGVTVKQEADIEQVVLEMVKQLNRTQMVS